MSKIYVTGRGCGKTYKLVQIAEVLLEEGITPIFVIAYQKQEDAIRKIAQQSNVDLKDSRFVTAQELYKLRGLSNGYTIKYRFIVDNVDLVLENILTTAGIPGQFYGSLDFNRCKPLVNIETEKFVK